MKTLKTLFKITDRAIRFVSYNGRTFKLVYQPYICNEQQTTDRVICAYLMTCNGWVEVVDIEDIEAPEIDMTADHTKIETEDLKDQASVVFEILEVHIKLLFLHSQEGIDFAAAYNEAKL